MPMQKPKNTLPRWAHVLCCGFGTALAAMLLFAVMGYAPFGGKCAANPDYLAAFSYFHDVLAGGNRIGFTFSQGLGGTGIAVFSGYLASPFHLLAGLFDKSRMDACVNLVLALKLGAAAAVSAWYLLRRYPSLGFRSAALLSAGYGLMFLPLSCMDFRVSDCGYLLPLLLLGIHRILEGRRCILLSAALGMSVLWNWHAGCMICLSSPLWFLAAWGFQRIHGPLFDLRRGLRSCIEYLLGLLLGGALGTGLLWPTICFFRANGAPVTWQLADLLPVLCAGLFFAGVAAVQVIPRNEDGTARRPLLLLPAVAAGCALLWSAGFLIQNSPAPYDFSDSLQNAVSALALEDDGFYRLYRDSGDDSWDPLIYGYASFSETVPAPDVIQGPFLDHLMNGMARFDPAAHSLLCAKYVLSLEPVPALEQNRLPVRAGTLNLYENPWSLPFAFLYPEEGYTLEELEETLDPVSAMYSLFLGEPVSLYTSGGEPDMELLESIHARITVNTADVELTPAGIGWTVEGTGVENLLLSIPCSEGWLFFRNGVSITPDTLDGCLVSIPLTEGENQIAVYYNIPGIRLGLMLSFAGLFILLLYGGRDLEKQRLRPGTEQNIS